MPHGDPSDLAALTHAVLGFSAIFAPHFWFATFGPLQPMFDGAPTPATLAAVKFAGGPLFFMAFTLFVVRWNMINGKAGALGCLVAAANSAYISLSMDSFSFVLRGWWVKCSRSCTYMCI